nr:lycopene cyclase family protein [Corynebacterium lactis]
MTPDSPTAPDCPTSAPIAAAVVGLGPAGRIAAHCAAARGWQVTAFDPAGGTLPSTIGLWAHQIPQWAPSGLVAASFFPAVMLADGSSVRLDKEYAVVNNAVLANLGGFEVQRKLASPEDVTADIIIETTGHSAAASGPGGQARQLAIGHVFDTADLPSAAREPVLMDFRQAPRQSHMDGRDCKVAGVGDTGRDCGGNAPASFSYRIPLGSGRFLIEETILATPVPLSEGVADDSALLALLRQRQEWRLKSLGVDPATAIEEEVVSFPLLRRNKARARVGASATPTTETHVPFGFAGGWMHPATGYSVGPVLEDVGRFLSALEATAQGRGVASARGRRWRLRWHGGRVAVAPAGGALTLALRERGLAALLRFDAEGTTEFFAAFFSLRQRDVFAYLTGASPLATLRAMASVAAPLARRNPKLLARLIRGFAAGVGQWRG